MRTVLGNFLHGLRCGSRHNHKIFYYYYLVVYTSDERRLEFDFQEARAESNEIKTNFCVALMVGPMRNGRCAERLR